MLHQPAHGNATAIGVCARGQLVWLFDAHALSLALPPSRALFFQGPPATFLDASLCVLTAALRLPYALLCNNFLCIEHVVKCPHCIVHGSLNDPVSLPGCFRARCVQLNPFHKLTLRDSKEAWRARRAQLVQHAFFLFDHEGSSLVPSGRSAVLEGFVIVDSASHACSLANTRRTGLR